ncbi:MAG: hypothetical protein JW889_12670 [Verrucomicrobia bacterium]|nr:hypothetical protein [Verrucomicrobiota bacterium]
MKTMFAALVAAALIGIVVTPAFPEGEAEVRGQTICPVMGGVVDKQYFADHNGKRVYFCCPACAPEFAKDPEKYIKKLEDEGITLDQTPDDGQGADEAAGHTGQVWICSMHAQVEQPEAGNCPMCGMDLVLREAEGTTETVTTQTACPNSGKPINKNHFADYNGKRVYFCGPGCVKAFKADPEPYMKRLADAGVVLEDAPREVKTQTMCPVLTNQKINKSIFADHEGKRVYFCCRSCQRAFGKNPAKYVKQLEDQGITLERVSQTSHSH